MIESKESEVTRAIGSGITWDTMAFEPTIAIRTDDELAAELRTRLAAHGVVVTNELLQIMQENLNGSPLASDGEVAVGYIKAEDHFHYYAADYDAFPRSTGAEGTRILPTMDNGRLHPSFIPTLILNCHYKRAGRTLTAEMFLTCYIKCLIAYCGVFEPNLGRRCVFVDEYTVHERIPDDIAETLRAVQGIKQNERIREQEQSIARNLHRLIGTVVHVMRTRNHHFQESSRDFVRTTWNAAWNGQAADWGISDESMFRLSLHCFGLKPLNDYTARAFAQNVMPVALKIRLTAARAGTAPVRLVHAAFQCMASEPFFEHVRAAFGERIDMVAAHVEELKAWGDAAHVNHWFISGITDRAPYNEALAEPLMPMAVAYIKSLGKLSSLKMQKALDKRVSNHASLVDAFAEKFEDYRDEVFKTTSLVELLAMYGRSMGIAATTA